MSARRQAAALPYRVTRLGTLELLLVSRTGGGWGVPKGGIKKGSDAAETARLEALEEAGVLGRLEAPPLGRYAYRKRGRKHEVVVLALEVEQVLARWEEDGRRVRVWVPLAEAPALLGRHPAAPYTAPLRHRLLTRLSRDRGVASSARAA